MNMRDVCDKTSGLSQDIEAGAFILYCSGEKEPAVSKHKLFALTVLGKRYSVLVQRHLCYSSKVQSEW